MVAGDIVEFERWVAHNSGPRIERASTAAFDLAGLAAAAGGQPVVSNSLLNGPGAEQARAADRAVNAMRTGSDGDGLLQQLAESPATGCAMVLTLAQQASGYNPADPAAAGNLDGFLSYVDQVLQCPVFSVIIHDRVQPAMSGDWTSVIDQFVSFYPGLGDQELSALRTSLWTLAQAASSTPATGETENLFVQSTLNAGEQLVLYMYQSFLTMRTDVESGGKHSPDTVTNNASLSLWRAVLKFDTDLWPRYAPAVVNRTNASLESWLNNTTTPLGSVAMNWTIR